VEPTTTDRIQRMIDAEAAERFPPDAVPRLRLLHYGDHPAIEPGERYLLVILGQDGAAWEAWRAAHFDRLEDFRAQRLPEVKGFMVTTDVRDSAGRPPSKIMQMDGISMLDPEEDEIARGLTPVTALLGSADLATLDALITAGIAASRSDGARWALARIREQPAYARLTKRTREPQPRAVLDRAVLDQLPDSGMGRLTLLEYGDDPSVEPGDLLVRVFIEEAEESPNLPAWHRDHETMIHELQRELADKLPDASHLEFWFGENGHQGKSSRRLGARADDRQDLTLADIRLGPEDLEMLDALITGGTAASRTEAVGWVLARIRERPAYSRLSERARELDELKTHF
jgi:hypothetical protein